MNWLKKSHTGDGYVETEALSTDEQYKKKGTNISFREFDKERIGLIVTALKRRQIIKHRCHSKGSTSNYVEQSDKEQASQIKKMLKFEVTSNRRYTFSQKDMSLQSEYKEGKTQQKINQLFNGKPENDEEERISGSLAS